MFGDRFIRSTSLFWEKAEKNLKANKIIANASWAACVTGICVPKTTAETVP